MDACVIKYPERSPTRVLRFHPINNKHKQTLRANKDATTPERHIPKGHRFSIKKTTTVHVKTTTPRSCLRWSNQCGRILKNVCLRWVPTGRHSALAQTKVPTLKVHVHRLKTYRGRTQSLVAKKKDISENRASRNFDLMITKWRLLKITLQAPTEYQLADMFTKALPEDRFKYLVRRIGMRCLTPADLEVLTNETA
ncbi:hypothetical protein Tco_0739728 [Tanacetum coccineum]